MVPFSATIGSKRVRRQPGTIDDRAGDDPAETKSATAFCPVAHRLLASAPSPGVAEGSLDLSFPAVQPADGNQRWRGASGHLAVVCYASERYSAVRS